MADCCAERMVVRRVCQMAGRMTAKIIDMMAVNWVEYRHYSNPPTNKADTAATHLW